MMSVYRGVFSVKWTVDELIPKSGIITDIGDDWVETTYPHFRAGDVFAFPRNAYRGVAKRVRERDGVFHIDGDAVFAWPGSMRRTVKHVTTRSIPHKCNLACRWTVDEDGHGWTDHDWSHDFEPMPIPHYMVEHVLPGHEILNVGPMYREGGRP